MIRYPNGMAPSIEKKEDSAPKKRKNRISASNRGMDFEGDINLSNSFYRDNHRALITKRPTPINIVKVDYSHGAHIIDAYFETQSTTDYNGVYRGKYLDFEAKSCHNKTSFPLHNITTHQISHLQGVIENGGIAFFLINFVIQDETYLVDAQVIIDEFLKGERKSIPYKVLKNIGHLVPQSYAPRLQYLDIVDEVYFNDKNN